MLRIASITQSIAEYWREDQNAKYGLDKTVSVTITGKTAGIGNADCGPLSIRSDKGGTEAVLTCSPFAADEGLWNGPDVLPNERDDGSMVASLWHDLIWYYAEEIAEQVGMSVSDVKQWGNGVLLAVWRSYAKSKGKWHGLNKYLAKAAFYITSWAKNWYGKVKG